MTVVQSRPPRERVRRLSQKPCETCGALPVGEYPTGRTVADRRQYDCGPHRPFKVTPDGTRVYLDEPKP